MSNRLQDVIRVPLTPSQSIRLARLVAEATAAATKRDEVLSALVEAVTDQSMQGWNIQIKDREIVLTSPMPIDLGGIGELGLNPSPNGQDASSQADAMSP